MCHPWVWLNEPQHAAAASAVTSIVSVIAGFAAAFLAYKAYIAANSQAGFARDQVVIAREALKADRERAKAEREETQAAQLAEYQRRIAEEEAMRPAFEGVSVQYLRMSQADDPEDSYNLSFYNSGSTEAIDLRLHMSKQTLFHRRVLRADTSAEIVLAHSTLDEGTFLLRFTTRYGSVWSFTLNTSFRNNVCEAYLEQVGVSRPYKPAFIRDDEDQ